MQGKYLTAALLILSSQVPAQDNDTNTGDEDSPRPLFYQFVSSGGRVYTEDLSTLKKVKNGFKFYWDGSTSREHNNQTYYLISPVHFADNAATQKFATDNPDFVNIGDEGEYFYVSTFEMKIRVRKVYSTRNPKLDIGAAVIPFRYRTGNKKKDRSPDAEFSAISALPTFAIKWRVSGYNPDMFIGPIIGFGVATSTVDAESFPNDSEQRKEYETAKQMSMLTGQVGAMFELRRGQIIFLIGKEFVGKNLNDWIYRKSLFFSVGIGTPIFSVNNKSNNKGTTAQNK